MDFGNALVLVSSIHLIFLSSALFNIETVFTHQTKCATFHVQEPHICPNILSHRGKKHAYPPIKIIGRFFMFSSSPIPACFAFLRLTAMPMTSSSSRSRGLTRSPASLARAAVCTVSSNCNSSRAAASIGSPLFAFRMMSRKETSEFPNKHTFKFPSEVMRSRLQVPQKLWVILVTNPTRP